MRPKIFVGTMYSGENDFQKCLEKVHSQVDVDVTHFVIAGEAEKNAHNELWRVWRAARDKHDLFIKIDADTVLMSETIMRDVWSQFKDSPRVTAVQAPLFDYMTQQLINGLNCFSPRVVFNDTVNELYCDRGVDSGHDIVLHQHELPTTLVPAGLHCYYASERQAFHYGIHRMLKNHAETIQKVLAAWKLNTKDRIRGFALLGASVSSYFRDGGFNYTDEKFNFEFNRVKETYDEQIARFAAS